MVAVWMVCNAVLAMAVSEAYALDKGIADNTYLKILLWSVAALAIFRALGSGTFAVMGVVAVLVEGRLSEKLARVLGGGKGAEDGSGGGGGESASRSAGGSEGGLTISAVGSSISSGLSVVSSKLSSAFSWVASTASGRR